MSEPKNGWLDKMRSDVAALDLRDKNTWLCTWGGLGLLRPGPGTWGTLGAVPFGIGFEMMGGSVMLFIMTFIFLTAGLRAIKSLEARLGEHDAGLIVIDEVVGYWLALAIASIVTDLSVPHYALAFVLFRALDIIKPYPIGMLDKTIPGAVGVMLDDLAAGFGAGILVVIAHYAIPHVF